MRPRRSTPWLLSAVVLAGGALLWRKADGGRQTAESGRVVAERVSVSRHDETLTRSATTLRGLPRPAIAAVPLDADSATVMSETATLQLLAHDTALDLAARQWSAFAAVTLKFQAIRQAYEATIATAAQVGPDRFRVDVPAYAVAGDALRAKFHAELRAQLGDVPTTEILAQFGAKLEGHFAGFGVSVQTLDIRADRASADFAVTRTVQFWNSIEGQAQLTTRRETHFPAQEDRESWQPLLALVSGE